MRATAVEPVNRGPSGDGHRPRNAQAGISMIEVLVATVVLALSALIAFPSLLSSTDLSKMAREDNIATHDMRSAIEDIMATPFALITQTYVESQPIPKYTDLHLADQQILVEYDDPASDPLSVVLVSTWSDSKGRGQREELRFMRTQ